VRVGFCEEAVVKEAARSDEVKAEKAYAPPGQGAPGDGAPQEDAARTAGRGGLVIVAAKVMFILYGFAQQILLQHLLGEAGYGEVALVNASVGVINNVLVAASIQGVSRTVAAAPEETAGELYRRVLGYHAVIAVLVAATFAALVGPIASLLHAEHVAGAMRLVAAVVLLYGIYAPIVGSLNGRKRFLDQGALDIVYGAIRTAGIVAGVLLFLRAGGSGTMGFCAGFVGAAALIVPAAMWRAGLGKASPAGRAEPALGKYLRFLLPVVVAQGCLNLLLRTDFFLLRYFAGEAAHAQGAAQTIPDQLLGVYQGVQLYAFLPYQLLMSITFILFPMLARAHADGDREAVRGFTRTGVRLSFVFTGLICGTVSALSMHVLRLASPEGIWRNGADALRILAVGMGTLSVIGIESAVLTSLKREVMAAALTITAVALVAIGCSAALAGAALGYGMLSLAAIATSAALGAAMVIGAVLVKRAAGGFVPVLTAVRVPIALACALVAGWKMPWLGKLLVVPQAAAIGVLYLLVLVLLREVGKEDLAMLSRVLRRGKKA
jgi:stage V sporulation protein B